MAKIKLKGHQDFIELSNVDAQHIKKMWLDQTINEDTKLEVGRITCEKSDIKNIILDESVNGAGDDFAKKLEQYEQDRDNIVAYPPIEKAKRSWSFFSFVYYGHYKKNPIEEEYKELVTNACRDFFIENPLWLNPNPLIFYQFIDKKLPIDSFVNRVMLNVLSNEWSHVRQKENQIKVEQRIEEINNKN
jgi:hypothetical protein